MSTKTDIEIVGYEWRSINILSDVSIGTEMIIQNKSQHWCLLVESDTKPLLSESLTRGVVITDLSSSEPSKIIRNGSQEIWAITKEPGRTAILSVQVIGG